MNKGIAINSKITPVGAGDETPLDLGMSDEFTSTNKFPIHEDGELSNLKIPTTCKKAHEIDQNCIEEIRENLNNSEQKCRIVKNRKLSEYNSKNLVGEAPVLTTSHQKNENVKKKETSGQNQGHEQTDSTRGTTKKSSENNQGNEPIQKTEHPPSPRNYLFRIEKNRKLFKLLNGSTKDCFICTSKGGYEKVMHGNLSRKYVSDRKTFNVKVINDIIYNENTHIVSVFKDYLIYDDMSEFLKRFYAKIESAQRLDKISSYYSKYSKVFPNYFNLPESKYMFKNIKRKQKAIDKQQEGLAQAEEKMEDDEVSKLFTSKFVQELNKTDSILGRTLREENVIQSTQMQSYMKSQESICQKGKQNCQDTINIDEMNLQQLVDKFILKDSKSLINVSNVNAQEITFEKIIAKPKTNNLPKEIVAISGKAGQVKARSKSRNSESRPIEKKDLAVDTKIKPMNVNPTTAQSIASHHIQTDSKVGPFNIAIAQTSRSQSTGKFSSHIEQSKKGSNQQERLTRIESTVSNLLQKGVGNERMRRSKSGVGCDIKPEKKISQDKKYFTEHQDSHRPRPSTAQKDDKRGSSTGREPSKTKKTVQTPSTSRPEKVQGKDSIKRAEIVLPSKQKPRATNSKGLGIDIDSINKCLKTQKGIMPNSKTIKTTKATANHNEVQRNGKKTPDSSRQFKSDYLNALMSKQHVNPTSTQQVCVRQQAQSVIPTVLQQANKLPMTQSCTAATLLSSSKSVGKLENPILLRAKIKKDIGEKSGSYLEANKSHSRKTSNPEGSTYRMSQRVQEPQ